jgi:hypothetical protein
LTVTDAAGKHLASAPHKLHAAPANATIRGSLCLLLVGNSLTHVSIYSNEVNRRTFSSNVWRRDSSPEILSRY